MVQASPVLGTVDWSSGSLGFKGFGFGFRFLRVRASDLSYGSLRFVEVLKRDKKDLRMQRMLSTRDLIHRRLK